MAYDSAEAPRAAARPMLNLPRPIPKTTLAVFTVTAIATALTFAYPHLIAALERTPTMLAHYEWWRFITPVLINPEGWLQIVANAVGLLVLGAIVEREFNSSRWLAIYFFSAIVGEIAGYAWKPNGAGSSVGVSGLLGAVGALLLVAEAPQARVGAFVILLGAATLAWFRDLHGPPILFGFALALLLHRLAHPPSPRKTMTQIV
jgi:membrane associated rhomboid family serine protease